MSTQSRAHAVEPADGGAADLLCSYAAATRRRLSSRSSTCRGSQVLRRADQVPLMDGGRVIARGTLDEWLTTSAEMRRLWRDEQGWIEQPSW
jgi:hypothetical protein